MFIPHATCPYFPGVRLAQVGSHGEGDKGRGIDSSYGFARGTRPGCVRHEPDHAALYEGPGPLVRWLWCLCCGVTVSCVVVRRCLRSASVCEQVNHDPTTRLDITYWELRIDIRWDTFVGW